MSGIYRTGRGPNGETLQSGVGTHYARDEDEVLRARGLLVRGVVIATYVSDANQSIIGDDRPHKEVYCDVLLYAGIEGAKTNYLPRCLVAQERAGLHDGDIWVPRATTADIEGNLNVTLGSNPADLNGDHVLIGFMDDDLALPVVLRSIPHPNADKGKTAADPIGQRVRPVEADGAPRLIKHRGVVFGIDKDGNFILDTTKAHNEQLGPNGEEQAPPEDGTAGQVIISVQRGAILSLLGPDGQHLAFQSDGKALLQTDTEELRIERFTGNNGLKLNADGTVDLTAENSADIRLGENATEAAVLGDTWKTKHNDYDAKLLAVLNDISAALVKIAASAMPAASVQASISSSVATELTQLATDLAAATAAINSLTSTPPLSGSVKVKT